MMRCIAMILACAALSSNATGEESSPWMIETRPLPAPGGASEILRESIAATAQPDVKARQVYPGSLEAWKQIIAQRKLSRPVSLDTLAQEFAVTIRTAKVAGVSVYRIEPEHPNPSHKNRLFLAIHGGAYVFNAGDGGVLEGVIIASRIGIPVLSVDYRMPPAHPFPAAVDDVVSVYREVLRSREPQRLAMGGTSAGGGLALAAVHQMKNLGLPAPGAVYAGTPWADLTSTGDTLATNEGIDRVLVSYEGVLSAAARLYAGEHDLKNPLISPLYGDFQGFPPTFLVSGTRDLFLSDTARTHRGLRAAGVTADLHVYEGLSHGGYLLVPSSPESLDLYRELDMFIDKYLL